MNASTLLDGVLDSGRADAVSLITDDGEVTYRELAGLVGATAARLRSLGVEREQRVLMVLDDSPAFHACFLGAMRIGAVPVPVNPMDRVDNHVYYLEDSYAKVVVIEDALTESRDAMVAVRPDVHVLSGSEVFGGGIDGGDLEAPVDTHDDDMAFWLYSSGSTGSAQGRRPLAPRYRGHDRELRPSGPAGDSRRTSVTRPRSCSTPTGSGMACRSLCRWALPPCWSAGGLRPTGSWVCWARVGPRSSSRCRRCMPRWRGRRLRLGRISPASAPACPLPSRCRRRCSSAGWTWPEYRSSTASGRPRCSTSTARTRSTTSLPARPAAPSPATSSGWSTRRAVTCRRASRGTCSSEGTAARRCTGTSARRPGGACAASGSTAATATSRPRRAASSTRAAPTT